MRIYKLKIILIPLFLIIGIVNVKATIKDDCLIDVLAGELRRKNSDKVYDYFMKKNEEECTMAFRAWSVLYKADKGIDRLDLDNIEQVYSYLNNTKKDVEEVVKEIDLARGFVKWKNRLYQFQREGYGCEFVTKTEPDGSIEINYYLLENGKRKTSLGESIISTDGILKNEFEIDEYKNRGFSEYIFKNIIEKNEIQEIEEVFWKGDKMYENLRKANNKIEAAKETPNASLYAGQDFGPVKVSEDPNNGIITVKWGKGATNEIEEMIKMLKKAMKCD